MKIVILGGGISGLSAAFHFYKIKPHAKIVLLEASSRLGGCIQSKSVGPFLFELGPRTFEKNRSPFLLKLIEEVGLKDEIIESDPSAKKRFIWHQNKLRSIPSFWPILLAAVAKDLVSKKKLNEDESIHDFAVRRFGKKIAEIFFNPMAKGVFGGDSRKLSLQSCFPILHEWEQRHRSIIQAMFKEKRKSGSLFTLKNGMGRLVDALSLLPIEICTNCPVDKLENEGVWANQQFWQADLIVSALPPKVISRISGIDLDIRMEPLSVVNFGFTKALNMKKGYGYLTTGDHELLGQIWDSQVFPIDNQTKLTSMVRGENPEKVALAALKDHLKIDVVPDCIHTTFASIPQYDLFHRMRIDRFQNEFFQKFPNVQLIGNYFDGASVESCIRPFSKEVYS